MLQVDEYTVTSLPLTLLCKSNAIGTATGFVYKAGGRTFLVSNWHVFSGRNTYTGQARHASGALPDAIRTGFHSKSRLGTVIEGQTFVLEDKHGSPTWLQHARGQDIDVAVLPIQLPENCTAYELPRPGETTNMAFRVGMDAYILGFPKGIAHQRYLPIWKRASIATEPGLLDDNLPVFLVDTATREGMSGAPVVLRSFGGYDTVNNSHTIGPGAFTLFIGVYSGRLGTDDPLGVQLGRVWHRRVIEEIIDTGVLGSYELRK